MNIAEIEGRLSDLVACPFAAAEFPFKFLEIYDAAKSTITKLRQGTSNQGTQAGDVLLKNKLFFRPAAQGDAAQIFDAVLTDPLVTKHHPRFLIVTDGVEFYARDQKADQNIDPVYARLNDAFDFFLPLAGIEKYEGVAENQVDIKATGKLSKLYDAILEANPSWIDRDHTHDLNQFMTRMLFCFFAEDTSIFDKGQFTATVINLTKEDGSDTAAVLTTLFEAMSTPTNERDALPDYARRFKYVNGGLFKDRAEVPQFSKRARRLFRECGNMTWSEINPDIFGSMIQAVVEPEMRGDMGMHYTSVPNIMKALHPLFLLSLEDEFEAAWDSAPKLNKLLNRIYSIRVFDPACGSGNFLIIAYRELRKLETRIFLRMKELAKQWSLPMSGVRLSQFYGIELADFAAETAKLSLWIAEYQMNEQFKETFGTAPPALPLRETGNIVQGNATRKDWLEICPPATRVIQKQKIFDLATVVPVLGTEIVPDEQAETYIVGNPPYLGRAQQNKDQKADIIHVFSGITKKFKNLDYVACWTLKAASYCKTIGAECAFVTTNSICQGEQVALLWPLIYQHGLEISFAHQSFKWRNNAAKNAGVTCIIVGIRPIKKSIKRLYQDDFARIVDNISPYLIEGSNLIVTKTRKPLSSAPVMSFGSMPNDGGHLILNDNERNALLADFPEAAGIIRAFIGSSEFVRGNSRHCLWISDNQIELAESIPDVRRRLEKVKEIRSESDREETIELSRTPHRFGEIRHREANSIIVPRVTSERRTYIPVGFLHQDTVVSDAAFAVYDPPEYLFAIIASRLHAVWTAAVGGHLKTDYRYSNTLVYNTFPIPVLSDEKKSVLEDHTLEILTAREAHPGKTIAWLYDPKTMPESLALAHRALDQTLETIYIGRPLASDSERLELLFKLYAAMVKKNQGNKPAKKKAVKAVETDNWLIS